MFALLLLAVAAAVYAVALKNQGRYAKLAEPEAVPDEIAASVPAPEPKTREWSSSRQTKGCPRRGKGRKRRKRSRRYAVIHVRTERRCWRYS